MPFIRHLKRTALSLLTIALFQAVVLSQSAPEPRQGHNLVFDERLRKIVLLDGYQDPNPPTLGQIWALDGNGWKVIPGTGPTARSLSAVTYDTRRKRILSFGGVGNSGYDDLRNDTWEWDGTRWHQMADTSIGTRDHHVMAFDEARGNAVMYGGLSSKRDLPRAEWVFPAETFIWNGSRWSSSAVPGPGPRAHFAMVYDAKRKQIVLFGGSGSDNRATSETWGWDGRAWTKLSDSGPPPRARHRMAYDRRSGLVLLYGGNGVKTQPGPGFAVLDDMWAWDGKSWTEIKANGPGKRFMHAMAYDAVRNKTILFGGSDGQQTLADTWEWDGRVWRRVGN